MFVDVVFVDPLVFMRMTDLSGVMMVEETQTYKHKEDGIGGKSYKRRGEEVGWKRLKDSELKDLTKDGTIILEKCYMW